MGFMKGRATFLRFQVSAGTTPTAFGQDQLDSLAANQIGRERIASADGVESGWTAGDHVLDTDFQLAKNVVGDYLLFDMRIDKDQIPGDLLRAYYETELKALCKDNPSGKPSAKQKREAKSAARDRVDGEAKDGRFRKRKLVPVVWDRHSGEVWFGAVSLSQIDRFAFLFERTFGIKLEAAPAGRRAFAHAELDSRTRTVDDAVLSAFVPGTTPDSVAWIADEAVKDFLGNEFTLWLWYYADAVSDTVTVADGSDVTFMLTGSLSLDCPSGQTGNETIRHEGPTRLPEAKRAIQAGKLPRKVGLTLVRQGDQYELGLGAELLAISGAKLPPPDDDVTDRYAVMSDRVDKLRSLVETFDLLYVAFLDRRLSAKWAGELADMQKWLSRGGV